ncbi:MAG: pyruvate dehydrogenase (acetyl-transferring) E1 component subunit alpha, partial [SAR202 cluster bacterium]|nr:pyruvate dehydrogenase (acetyl-transferring) E1 component subunit alpha [SAR202 cluster bacterium]
LAVREAAVEAIERVRSGGGPVFLEAMTYRFRGHSMADPSSYREGSEVDRWSKKDPITMFSEKMEADGLLSRADMSRIDDEIAGVVEDAVKFAEESPDPDIDTIYEHVYA